MRRESENWSAYRQLREELLNSIRDQEVDITGLKAEFAARGGRKVLSRRRLEAIRSMSQMIEECEHHLLISPDKRGIKYFKKLVEFVKCRSSQLISDEFVRRVSQLTHALEPAPAPPPPQCSTVLLPREMKEKLIHKMTDAGAGQDWEHFILGLGRKLPQADDIRIRQGDLDRLERTFAGNRTKIMNCALVDFERNCQKYEVNINIAQHVVEVLKDKDILFPPYTRLANDLRKMM